LQVDRNSDVTRDEAADFIKIDSGEVNETNMDLDSADEPSADDLVITFNKYFALL
jgi:hypothetical protein